MDEKIKFHGAMKRWLRWPLYFALFILLVNIAVYFVDIKAGFVATAGLLLYALAAWRIFSYYRPLIHREMTAFASQYETLEKQMLEDMNLPYAVMDMDGRLVSFLRKGCVSPWEERSMIASAPI